MDILKCYDDFMLEKRAYCSCDTVSYYELNIGSFFLPWLSDRVESLHNVNPDMLDKTLFLEYLTYLRCKKIKNVSVRSYFRAVRVFIAWLVDNGYMEKDCCKGVKMPKNDCAIKIPLSGLEVRRIDSVFLSCENDFYKIRNYCLFHLMLDCGLRLGEICSLTLKEINFENHFLHFKGKGSKWRVVPCPDFLLCWFEQYIKYYRHSSEEYVFCNIDGDPISKNCVKLLFSKMKDRSGVKRVHCHLLRHTFATSYIIGGGNLEFLRLLLGHSDYLITQNYLHCASEVSFLNLDIYHLDKCFFKKAGYSD